MNRPAFAMAILVASALLAGCAGNSETAEIGPTIQVGQFGSGTAGLRGQVVDPEYAPVMGALVRVGAFDPLTTNEAGFFEARGLEPGTYPIEIVALGFVNLAREVVVREGEPAVEEFRLERLPSVEPFVETLQFRGTSQCDYMLLVSTGRVPGCPAQNNRFDINVTEGWTFLIVEQVWQSQTATAEWFRVFTSDDNDCTDGSPCYGLVYGNGYARLEGEPGKTDLVTHYDPWADGRGPAYPNETFPMRINSQWIGLLVEETNTLPGDPCQVILQAATGTTYKRGCVGWGVSTGVVFDLWVSIFHHAPPDDLGACCPASQYSALPDD